MLKYIKSIAAGGLLGLLIGTAAVGPAWSQVILNQTPMPAREPSPRMLGIQAVHYIRTTLSFNMCTATANVCTIKAANAALPYNAIVLRVTLAVYTVFNSTTSDTLLVGTTAASANEIVSSAMNLRTIGTTAGTVLAASLSATGGATAQTGLQGGFDVWMKWTAGTGNTATTGLAAVVIEYIAPNDGLCSPVSLDTATVPGGC